MSFNKLDLEQNKLHNFLESRGSEKVHYWHLCITPLIQDNGKSWQYHLNFQSVNCEMSSGDPFLEHRDAMGFLNLGGWQNIAYLRWETKTF